MLLRRRSMLLAALTASTLSLSACGENLGKGPVLHIESGHIKLGATDDAPAAGYFTVQGGGAPVELVAVTADLAQRVEMHESVKKDGMMTMQPITSAAVPAGGELKFAPGGKHIMLWKINGAAVKAGKLPMLFIFSNNERISFDLKITTATPGDAAGHQGH